MTRAAAGERSALEALARDHYPAVRRTALAILGEADMADDVAQDVFVRLQVSLPGFRGEADLSTWLYRVTLNLCRDQLRGVRRRAEGIARAAGDEGLAPGSARGADQRVDAARAQAAVRAALSRLPDEQREAVTLRYIVDLPYAEIARLTNVPVGTVASRVFRALERLGADLEPHHLEVVQ